MNDNVEERMSPDLPIVAGQPTISCIDTKNVPVMETCPSDQPKDLSIRRKVSFEANDL